MEKQSQEACGQEGNFWDAREEDLSKSTLEAGREGCSEPPVLLPEVGVDGIGRRAYLAVGLRLVVAFLGQRLVVGQDEVFLQQGGEHGQGGNAGTDDAHESLLKQEVGLVVCGR